jgi:SET domain-containing protein
MSYLFTTLKKRVLRRFVMASAKRKTTSDSTRLGDKVYVSGSPGNGQGVFARVALKKGEYIGTYEGPKAQRNGKFVLWLVGRGRAVGRRGLNALRFLNHADTPNAEFDGWDLYATKRIPKDTEITFDYGGDGE